MKTMILSVTSDILEKIEIPYEDAILGTKYRLVFPDKKEVEVTITKNFGSVLNEDKKYKKNK